VEGARVPSCRSSEATVFILCVQKKEQNVFCESAIKNKVHNARIAIFVQSIPYKMKKYMKRRFISKVSYIWIDFLVLGDFQ
jgi:hypothetical protein